MQIAFAKTDLIDPAIYGKGYFNYLNQISLSGFMTNQEKELFQAVPCNEFNTYWIPCTWFIYRYYHSDITCKNSMVISEWFQWQFENFFQHQRYDNFFNLLSRIQEAAKKGKLINNYALETIIRVLKFDFY